MRDSKHPVKSGSLCLDFYNKLFHESFNMLNSKSSIGRGFKIKTIICLCLSWGAGIHREIPGLDQKKLNHS